MNKKNWEDQLEYNRKFFADLEVDIDSLSTIERVQWLKEFQFHIVRELVSLADCYPYWTTHVSEMPTLRVVESNVAEELVDVFKYTMCLAQVLGVSYRAFSKAYAEKTLVVNQRYAQQQSLQSLRGDEVVMFDIDGVLNTYPDCFISWSCKRRNIKCKTHEQLRLILGLDDYQNVKEEYRLSGAKRRQPVNKDAIETIDELVRRGERIVLYTARPMRKYKRIYSDTLFWLRKNQIQFDAIFWSDLNKEDVCQLGLKIKFAVDDASKSAETLNAAGIRVYLVDKYHNADYNHKLTTRVQKVSEILQ